MSEQLSMFDSLSDPDEPIITPTPEVIYEPLDKQLAQLMVQLNGEKNPVLKNCVLEISKHTREGQIAINCSLDQQTALLKTKVVGEAGEYKPLILDAGYLYLNRYFTYQQHLAGQIKSRLLSVETIKPTQQKANCLQDRLDVYFPKESESEQETNWQRVAAEQALQQQFLIVSGGPGTGKTTTITRILALLIEQNVIEQQALQPNQAKNKDSLRILLAAPTGKAAIRMLDSIRDAQSKLNLSADIIEQLPNHASTLHKLLGYKPNSVQFKHNQQNPLSADVVLVDEASMIDIAMMSKLLDAVSANAKLILIGDKNQLSSVETGSVFADICNGLSNPLSALVGRGEKLETSEGEINTSNIVTLQKNWRFTKDSGIGQLAIATNQGDDQKTLAILKDENQTDCHLVSPDILSGMKIPNALIAPWENYFKALKNPDASIAEIFEAFNQYRVLCALRRGLNGSTIMSSRIETELAKQGFLQIRSLQNRQNNHKQSWYHGRPVMITQNSYSKGLFNGDTGITLLINDQLNVYFPDEDGKGFKSLAPVRLPAHETTWAMTIHKSQGSEFNQVALILPHEVMPLLTRQLIYTGITRAKEDVSLVASEGVLSSGIKTQAAQATQIGAVLSKNVISE